MKKFCLFTLVMLLLSVSSSFALPPPPTETGQRIYIPYTAVGNGYWSGLAITNTSDISLTFAIRVYRQNGTYVDGKSFTVAAHAMKVDALENFLSGTAPDTMVSIRIQTGTNETFRATLFIGNEQGGFGFQNYKSDEYTYPVPIMTTFEAGD